MTYYHVAPSDYTGGDLVSLYKQHGDTAYEMYTIRWPEADELAQYHAHYVHLYESLGDARTHVQEFGGSLLAVDASELEVEIDSLEFAHPMVRDLIPAECIQVVE